MHLLRRSISWSPPEYLVALQPSLKALVDMKYSGQKHFSVGKRPDVGNRHDPRGHPAQVRVDTLPTELEDEHFWWIPLHAFNS